MASRAEQKAAARKAREAKQQELHAAATRRQRLLWLGGIVGVAVIALVVVVIASSNGGGSGPVHHSNSQTATAVAAVNQELHGIPQSGNTLGNPKAPVTITEYGDLVCPTCDDFALTSVVVTPYTLPTTDGDPMTVGLQLTFLDGRKLDTSYTAPMTTEGKCGI